MFTMTQADGFGRLEVQAEDMDAFNRPRLSNQRSARFTNASVGGYRRGRFIMLSNIIKNHPFKLIAGIMLVGSLVNPAHAASKEEWTHGFIHAKNSKAQASLSVSGSNCDVVEMAFLGIRPIKSLYYGAIR